MIEVNTKNRMKKMQNVYKTIDMAHSLISVGKLMQNKYKLVFEDGKYDIFDKNHGNKLDSIIHMTANRLFPMKLGDKEANILTNMVVNDMSWMWHLRFGHLNFNNLKLSHELVHGLPLIEDPKFVCDACVLGK